MMDLEKANQFAEAWIHAWNSHDLDAILDHYADEVAFYSPFIPLLKFNTEGVITSKTDLKRYFEIGLRSYPELQFRLHGCLAGVRTLVLYYTSVSGRMAAEVFELNDQGQAVNVYCNYSSPINHELDNRTGTA